MFTVTIDPRLGLDKDGDGNIVSSGKDKRFGSKGTVNGYVKTGESEWIIYNKKTETAPEAWNPTPPAPTPDPLPPVTPPAKGLLIELFSNDEAGIQTDDIGFGFGAYGTLGMTKNVPAKGWRTDRDEGFLRLGMFPNPEKNDPKVDDVILMGRSIDLFTVGYLLDSKKVLQTSGVLTGYTQIRGKWSKTDKSLKFAGKTVNGHFETTREFTVEGETLRIDWDLKNVSGKDVTDVRLLHASDPDQMTDDNGTGFATTNKIENERTVSCKLLDTDRFFVLATKDDRFKATFYGFVTLDPFLTPVQAVGYAKKKDETAQLTGKLGDMKNGDSTSGTFYIALTKDVKSFLEGLK